MCVCVCVCVCVCASVYVCACVCCMCVCMCVRACVSMCVCVHVRAHTCMCLCIYVFDIIHHAICIIDAYDCTIHGYDSDTLSATVVPKSCNSCFHGNSYCGDYWLVFGF